MKLVTNKASGRVYAKLKTGNAARPYMKMSLGTKSAEEARKKAKAAKLPQIEAALQAGSLSQQAIARLTVGKKLSTEKAAEQWIASGPNRGDAPATLAKNRSVLDHWFNHTPAVRAMAPMSIDESHIAPFINRQDEDVGARTRMRQLSVIRMFLRYCADLGVAQGNAANRVKVDHRSLSHEQREPKKVAPFTTAEISKIVANTEGWWRWATAISAATGMRLGDICQLEHASLAVPGHIIVWTDKRDGRVCLPIKDKITPGLAEALAEIPPSDSPYLFPEQKAQYDDVKSGRPKFSVYFSRELAALGIEGKSFHSLRHYAISRWKRDGFSLDECKDYAGHSNSKTTQGYIHE